MWFACSVTTRLFSSNTFDVVYEETGEAEEQIHPAFLRPRDNAKGRDVFGNRVYFDSSKYYDSQLVVAYKGSSKFDGLEEPEKMRPQFDPSKRQKESNAVLDCVVEYVSNTLSNKLRSSPNRIASGHILVKVDDHVLVGMPKPRVVRWAILEKILLHICLTV